MHWAPGGKTDLDNLVLLCCRHHWMVHAGRNWSAAKTEAWSPSRRGPTTGASPGAQT